MASAYDAAAMGWPVQPHVKSFTLVTATGPRDRPRGAVPIGATTGCPTDFDRRPATGDRLRSPDDRSITGSQVGSHRAQTSWPCGIAEDNSTSSVFATPTPSVACLLPKLRKKSA